MLFFSCFRACSTIDTVDDDRQQLLYIKKPITITSKLLPKPISKTEYAEFIKKINIQLIDDNIEVFTTNINEPTLKEGTYVRYVVEFIQKEKVVYSLYFILAGKKDKITLTVKPTDSLKPFKTTDHEFLVRLFSKIGFEPSKI